MSDYSGNKQVGQSAFENITARNIKINSFTQQVIASTSKAGIPFQVPPLPAHFVECPEPRHAIKTLLLTQAANIPGTLVISVIYGLGGIGKSTLAAALAYDPDVKAHFPDGVLWATLGQQPELLSFLSGWIQALGDYNYRFTTLGAASMHLRTLLSDKKTLLVVDDVWNPEDVEPFRVGGSGCRVLVTTREAAVPGATRYNLDVMTKEQSLELLGKAGQGGTLTKVEQQHAETLAEEVGYLPLALELAVVQVIDGVAWAELLEELQAEVAQLEAFDCGEGKASSEEKRKRLSLVASFNLSLRQLSPEQLKQFAWLGVLPEDVSITQAMAATLWEVKERQAGAILRSLRSRSLLLPGAIVPIEKPTYRIHDLMHDAAKRLLTGNPVPIQPEKLSGLGLTLPAAHSGLLERYRAKTQNDLWHTLPDDGYIHQRLVWHLEKAEQVEEIHSLLREDSETGGNGWYEACDHLGQTTNFVTDVGRAWKLAEDSWTLTTLPQVIGLQCRYALIIASLNSLAARLPVKLLIALVQKNVWTPEQGLAYVLQSSNPENKANLLKELVHHLPPNLKELALSKALAAAREIQDEYDRADALRALSDKLPSVLPEALKAASKIQSEYDRADALSALFDKLPPQLLPEALKAAKEIQSEYDRAKALSALADKLPSVLPEALKAAKEIQDESYRAKALSALADRLPPQLLPEALKAAREIQSESCRAKALSALSDKLPSVLPEALKAAKEIQDESYRAKALSALADKLPPQLLSEALKAAREIQSESCRAKALSALSDKLPSVLPEALKAAKEIQDESYRAKALSALTDKLPPQLLPEALKAAKEIQDESYRAKVLRALADKLPPQLLPEALKAAKEIQDESYCSDALRASSDKLPSMLPEALKAARKIQDESYRADVLSALADKLSQMPQSQLFPLWQDSLHWLSLRTRKDLLHDIQVMVPEIFALGSDKAIAFVNCAIQDVARWWY